MPVCTTSTSSTSTRSARSIDLANMVGAMRMLDPGDSPRHLLAVALGRPEDAGRAHHVARLLDFLLDATRRGVLLRFLPVDVATHLRGARDADLGIHVLADAGDHGLEAVEERIHHDEVDRLVQTGAPPDGAVVHAVGMILLMNTPLL